MNLDDLDYFKKLDTLNMLGEIDNLPDQLAGAYQLGMQHPLPDVKDVRQVVIAGMGGSAIGADLLASYCASLAPLPVSVHRDYGLPLFARGSETLVICSSHSGNTEETSGCLRCCAPGRMPCHGSLYWRRTGEAGKGEGTPGLDVRAQGPAACRRRIFVWPTAGSVRAAGFYPESKGSHGGCQSLR